MAPKKYLSLILGFFFIASVISSDLRRILPVNLEIRKGEDLQLRLESTLPNTLSCYVKTPLLTSFNLMDEEPDAASRISYWTENGECGVIARNVTKGDRGRWRLTAKNSTHTLVDASFVEILDEVETQENSFSIESGLEYTLTLEEKSKYCWVHQPHSDTTLLVSGECKVDLTEPTTAISGKWSATAGVVGQLQEVSAEAELNVLRDRLATGFTKNNNTNTISVYCNLRYSNRAFEFCRFAKPDSEKTGFQLSEGLRSGRYAYYGAGLKKGECGISIEAPTQEDYGQWQCSVGVKDAEPFGSYIEIYNDTPTSRASAIEAKVLPTNTTTTFLKAKLQLRCASSAPISYCWFLAPNREVFIPQTSVTQDDAPSRYIGNGFGKGECGIEITTAEAEYEGQWTCHMGPELSGFELTSTINVRIAETPLAAMDRNITVTSGEALSLECRTVPDRMTVDYCRFLMPDGTGIHIGDTTTETNPLILDDTRYWFSSISQRLGGCGLTVDKVSSKHSGSWTCAARLALSQNNSEAIDKISVHIEESDPSTTENTVNNEQMTATATTGIISGVVVAAIILALGSVYLVKKIRARRSQDNGSTMGIVSMPSSSRRSSSSTNSGMSLQEVTRGNREST